MYRVFLERAAENDLKSLSSKLHNRIIVALQALAQNPRPSGCRKLTGADNDWRIRVGDYRIVYQIDDAQEIVRVILTDTVGKSIVELSLESPITEPGALAAGSRDRDPGSHVSHDPVATASGTNLMPSWRRLSRKPGHVTRQILTEELIQLMIRP